jgi:hypothetical protein
MHWVGLGIRFGLGEEVVGYNESRVAWRAREKREGGGLAGPAQERNRVSAQTTWKN